MYPDMFEKQFNNDSNIRVAGLQKRKQEILFFITQTSDATEISDLKSQLRQTQMDMQQAVGESSALESNEAMIRKLRALSIVSQNSIGASEPVRIAITCGGMLLPNERTSTAAMSFRVHLRF